MCFKILAPSQSASCSILGEHPPERRGCCGFSELQPTEQALQLCASQIHSWKGDIAASGDLWDLCLGRLYSSDFVYTAAISFLSVGSGKAPATRVFYLVSHTLTLSICYRANKRMQGTINVAWIEWEPLPGFSSAQRA